MTEVLHYAIIISFLAAPPPTTVDMEPAPASAPAHAPPPLPEVEATALTTKKEGTGPPAVVAMETAPTIEEGREREGVREEEEGGMCMHVCVCVCVCVCVSCLSNHVHKLVIA